MMVDGEWVEVEHDEGAVRIRYPKINGGEWIEEKSPETEAIKNRHDLYTAVRRMFRQGRIL
jgi:hypothetical protein